MSEDNKKIVLIGGEKDGTEIDWERGVSMVNHIKLNETLDGIEYVDHYVPSQMTDRHGRVIFVTEHRYDASESETFWEQLDPAYKMQLIEAEKAERDERDEEEATNEESANDDTNDAGDESNSDASEASDGEASNEAESSEGGDAASEDEAAGEEAGVEEVKPDDEESTESSDGE